jgi:tetratricopeptide (TPR) repeat protein
MGRYARRLLNEARKKPRLFLEQQRFWKAKVFDELLEEITQLLHSDTQAALELATIAPSFAECVADFCGMDPIPLRARAYGRLGSVYRASAQYTAAEETYNAALRLPAPACIHADINRRRAYLRAFQDKPAEGVEIATLAIETLKTSDELLVDRHPLGLALAARAYCYYNDGQSGAAATDASAAIALINHRTRPRDYYFTLHNLTYYLIDTMTPEQLARTLENLDAAYRRFIEYSQRHIARYKIRWLQAIAHKRFGANRQAERLFLKARDGLLAMGAASEVAIISLDLVLLYIDEGQLDDAKSIAKQAYLFGEKHGLKAPALAALLALLQARQQELTITFLASIRQTITQHAQPYGVSG